MPSTAVSAALIALAGAAAGCVWLLADTRAPLSGVLLVAWAAAVVAAAAMTTLVRALLLAVSVIGAPVAVALAAAGAGDARGASESCDPGCISSGGAIGLAVLVAAVLALVGLAVGAVWRRLRAR